MISKNKITPDVVLSVSEAAVYIEELSNSQNDKRLLEMVAHYEDSFGHKLDLDSIKAGLFVANDILDCVTW